MNGISFLGFLIIFLLIAFVLVPTPPQNPDSPEEEK